MKRNSMDTHRRLSDEDFVQRFADCTLPVELFSHEAHLRLAWIHVTRYGIDHARESVPAHLRAYVAHAGAESKYHHTVTIAGVEAVHHFISKGETTDFYDLIERYPKLVTDFKALINSHYSYDIFSSDAARWEYVEPDLVEFS